MRGLLADANVEGHVIYLRILLKKLGLEQILIEQGVEFLVFADVSIRPDINDRLLWSHCQQQGLVLFTDNRNREDADSLQATLDDSWRPGHLPVLTLANRSRFATEPNYALRTANDVAELSFDIFDGKFCDRPRIFVPLSQ